MTTPSTPSPIENAVVCAIARAAQTTPEQIQPSTRLYDDLGLDSMNLIHVNIAIEEQLGGAYSLCEAPEDELQTVGDVVNFVGMSAGRGQEPPTC